MQFDIPNAFLKGLYEFSNGGYALIIFDANGNPAVISEVDSPAHSVALDTFAEQFFAVRNRNRKDSIKKILEDSESGLDEDGDDEDGDEGEDNPEDGPSSEMQQ